MSAADDDGPLYLGHYRIEKTLGQGSYGKVKLATNTKTNEKVALKFIQKANIKKPVHMARIKREVRLLKLLHHKHIVRLYEVAETNHEIILTMENAGGGELFDYIVAHHHLKEKEARRLFRQIVSAMDYCHTNCIIHRDLKPENLLLDQDHNIKIIDFGFANSFDPNGLLGTFCGSPFYASPEMILGKRYVGPEVDIWSMGVILFALVCGHLPFDDSNMRKLYQKIVDGKFTCPTYLTPPCVDLIQKMITVDASKRIGLEEIKNHPWVLEDYGVPPTNEKLSRPVPAELDDNLVSKLAFYGVDEKTAREKIMMDPKSTAFATYYLLLEKAKRDEDERQQRAAAAAAAAENANAAPGGAAAGQENAAEAGEAGGESGGAAAGSNAGGEAGGDKQPAVRPVGKTNRRQTIAATEASTWQKAAQQTLQAVIADRDNTKLAQLASAAAAAGVSVMATGRDGRPIYNPPLEAGKPPAISVSVGATPAGPYTAPPGGNAPEAGQDASQASAATAADEASLPSARVEGSNAPPPTPIEQPATGGQQQRQPSTSGVPTLNVYNEQGQPKSEQQAKSQQAGQRRTSGAGISPSQRRPSHHAEQTGESSQYPNSLGRPTAAAPPSGPADAAPAKSNTLSRPVKKANRFSFDEAFDRAVHKAAELVANRFRGGAGAGGAPGAKRGDPNQQPTDIDSTSQQQAQEAALAAGEPTSDPRVVKGLFNVATSTSKPIPEIFVEVKRVLRDCEVEYSLKEFTFQCCEGAGSTAVLFEIEVCRIHKLALYGLNFKRIKGESWPYKKLANKISSQLRL